VIVIKANPGRIEEVAFTGVSAAERAIEAATWPVIALLVDRIDRKLRSVSHTVLRELERDKEGR
jgi:tRNA(Ile2) C34 agmatinyltransferase TiaS